MWLRVDFGLSNQGISFAIRGWVGAAVFAIYTVIYVCQIVTYLGCIRITTESKDVFFVGSRVHCDQHGHNCWGRWRLHEKDRTETR